MEDVSEVWPVDGDEFFQHLIRQDRVLGNTLSSRERRLCITWIVRACSDYALSSVTGVLAVKLYDAFIHKCRQRPGLAKLTFKQLVVQVGSSVVDISKHKESQICELMCIVCIALAAKKCEAKEKAPFLGDFADNFSFQDLRAMEHHILNALCWNVSFSTPSDFVQYWVERSPCGVNRAKTNALCHEAIAKCITEIEFASPKKSSLFGTAVVLWAYNAQSLPTAELQKNVQSLMGQDMVELHLTVEQIATHLSSRYPHAVCAPCHCRTDSPGNIVNVTSVFCERTQCDPLPMCVKRTPERFLPNGKKAKSESPEDRVKEETLTEAMPM